MNPFMRSIWSTGQFTQGGDNAKNAKWKNTVSDRDVVI